MALHTEPMILTALLALVAVLADWVFGEPRRLHPLVGFGAVATAIEAKHYGDSTTTPLARRMRGAMALLLLLSIFTIFASLLGKSGAIFNAVMLYFALGHKSLHDHARPVADALRISDDTEARQRVGQIVSRDFEAADIPTATTESVLENGNDAVFGALFWFAIAGGPGAVLYRLANTLDAMWGYRNDQYRHFGWAAARVDDVLNFIPARLTAATYAALGQTRQALRCWRTQAPGWDSPNAGPVMAAGAGALGITLGGPARYKGEWHQRPILGAGKVPGAADIERALRLVRHGVYLWIGLFFVAAGVDYV